MEAEISRYPEGWRFFTALVSIFIIALGLIDNLVTIIALLKYPKLHNVTTVFIINLCVADIVYCLSILPFSIIVFRNGRWTDSPQLCTLATFLILMNHGVNLLFMIAITINRYVMIVHAHLYNKIYTKHKTICMITFCYIFICALLLPSLFKVWGELGYDKNEETCSMIPDANGVNPKNTLTIIVFIIPCIIISACYTKIFLVVRNSTNRLLRHTSTTEQYLSSQKNESKQQNSEWKIAKMTLVIFLVYCFCYLPFTIVRLIDPNVDKHPRLYLMSSVLVYTNACINPIIYVVMSKQYRAAYTSLICCYDSKTKKAQGLRISMTPTSRYPRSLTTKSTLEID